MKKRTRSFFEAVSGIATHRIVARQGCGVPVCVFVVLFAAVSAGWSERKENTGRDRLPTRGRSQRVPFLLDVTISLYERKTG